MWQHFAANTPPVMFDSTPPRSILTPRHTFVQEGKQAINQFNSICVVPPHVSEIATSNIPDRTKTSISG
jgi:hypothetical protein